MNAAELLPCFTRFDDFHHGCRPDDPAQHPHRPTPQFPTGELKVDPEIRLRAGKFDLNVSFFYSSQSDSDQDYGRGRSASVAGHVLSATSGSIVTVVRGDFTEFPFKRWGESGGIVTFVAPSNRGVVTTLTFERIEHPDGGRSTYTYAGGGGGRPTGIRRPGAGPRAVDGEGLRRSHHEPGQELVATIWDGTDYLLQKSAAATARYAGEAAPPVAGGRGPVPGADGEILAEKRSGSRLAYVPDPLGSVVGLLNTSQAFTDTFAYWPYGEVRARTGSTATPFQYIGALGYHRDRDWNTYVRARYLRGDAGRWLTADPANEHAKAASHGTRRNRDASVPPPRLDLQVALLHQYHVTGFTTLGHGQLGHHRSLNHYEYCRSTPPNVYDASGLFVEPLPPNHTNWCGYSRRGPAPPVDCIDQACWHHDRCLASWWDIWKLPYCNYLFCLRARGCSLGMCVFSPSPLCCQWVTFQVLSLFCLGQPPFPPGLFIPYPL